MECPTCKDTEAKKVRLLTSNTFLCQNESCRYYDAEHQSAVARQRMAVALADSLDEPDWDLSALEDSNDELQIVWPVRPITADDLF